MASQHFLAIDLGAESGRGILADFNGERIELAELGRFATGAGDPLIDSAGVRRWPFERICADIESVYRRAHAQWGPGLSGVAADSWGVDFGLLDANGELLEPPAHYRNTANADAMMGVHRDYPSEELWRATGIQSMAFNTLCQIAAIKERDPGLLARARTLLMIPDLLHRRLGALDAAAERTNASTTQMLDAGTASWDTALCDRLDLPTHFLPPLIDGGIRVGRTPEDVPIYAPCTHDTASAVAAAPAAAGTNWAFLSSGTWSLLGAEIDRPELSAEACVRGFSNERGANGKVTLLKNIMGLWLVQECRRSIKKRMGREYVYEELMALAESASPSPALVDAADPRFLAPQDMWEEISKVCAERNCGSPETPAALIRCCLESLAHAYSQALRDLERVTGKTFDVLHVVGGGAKNRVLNQWAADACGIRVYSGPTEAAALGNVLAQMIGAGEIAGWHEARELLRRSVQPGIFLPNAGESARWRDREA